MSEVYVIGASCMAFGKYADMGFQAQCRFDPSVEQVLANREAGVGRAVPLPSACPGARSAEGSPVSTVAAPVIDWQPEGPATLAGP